jgi:hypothetical protein
MSVKINWAEEVDFINRKGLNKTETEEADWGWEAKGQCRQKVS